MGKRFALLFFCLLAFGVRVWGLAEKSLDVDEAISASFAQRAPTQIVTQVFPDHPPLYYLILHVWADPAAGDEFSLRFLTVGFGLLLVPLTYCLAREVMGSAAGVAAALFTSVSSFQIFHSQQVRPHILATLLGALSAYLFLRALGRNRWHYWAAYVLATFAAAWTFYYALYVPLVEAVVFVILWKKTRGRRLPWLLSQLALVVLYLPWVIYALPRFVSYAPVRGVGLSTTEVTNFIQRVVFALSLGEAIDINQGNLVMAPFLILLGLGAVLLVWRLWHQPRGAALEARLGTALPLAFLLIPLGGTYLINLIVPHFIPRYLLVASPFYILALAAGAVGLLPHLSTRGPLALGWGWAILSLAGVGALSVFSLRGGYESQFYTRPDYRSLVQDIVREIHPDDAIVLNAPWQEEAFGYYYRGENPVFGIPEEYPLDEAITTARLSQLISDYRGVWLVLYGNGHSDPSDFVEGWLAARAVTVDDAWYGQARLRRFEVPPSLEEVARIPHGVDFRLGDKVRLLGYDIGLEVLQPGGPLYLTIYWQALDEMNEDYTVFNHLVDSGNQGWGQQDGQPVSGGHPTSQWEKGEIVRDRHRISTSPQAPRGEYRILVGMYRLQDMERLPVRSPEGSLLGTSISLGPVYVEEADK